MNRNIYYKLDGHTPVPCSLIEWAETYGKQDRQVAVTKAGKVSVSTVFLGNDYQFGSGPPLLFETMIFGGEHDEYQERCSTWDDAVAQHEVACKLAGVKS